MVETTGRDDTTRDSFKNPQQNGGSKLRGGPPGRKRNAIRTGTGIVGFLDGEKNGVEGRPSTEEGIDPTIVIP